MTSSSTSGRNAYIGPRPFRQGEKIYGREREIRQLFYLLGAERIVLLHSPSGAGKTSLIRAGLIPWLKREKFYVWPTIRLSLHAEEGPQNRYTASAILSLEEELPADKRRPIESLSQLSLSEYISSRPRPPRASPRVVLIFDQFEEILTADPLALEAKRDFFRQLGEALRDPLIWALIAIREDYLAPLDPYLDHVPTRLGNRFRLELLGLDAARQAVIQPACDAGREFHLDAAEKLVRDLASVKVQRPDGSFLDQTGPHVEPVQLQVVCFRLWDRLRESDHSISLAHLEQLGDVDEALSEYYSEKVERLGAGDTMRERRVREWFSEQLITPGGVRNQVLMGEGESGGLENSIIAELRNFHLVRREKRAGATWFELAHDRLVEPVRSANRRWFLDNLQPFQRRAAGWGKEGKPESLLLKGVDLKEAEKFSLSQPEALLPIESELIEDSRRLRKAERSKRLLVVSILAAAILVAAWTQVLRQRAEREARIARSRLLIAQSASQPQDRFDVPILLALQAYRLLPDAGSRSNLIRQLRRPSEELSLTLRGHEDAVSQVGWSSNGEMLASAGYDGRVNVWQFPSGELVESFEHDDVVTRLAWSPDGKWLASGGLDDKVGLWAMSPSSESAAGGSSESSDLFLDGHQATITGLAWSPQGRLATASADGSIKLWEPGTDRLRPLFSHDDVIHLAWSLDGQVLASGSYAGTVKLWNSTWSEPVALRYPGSMELSKNLLGPDASPSLKRRAAVTSLAWQEYEIKDWVVGRSQKYSILAFANDYGEVFVAENASPNPSQDGQEPPSPPAADWTVRRLDEVHASGITLLAWAGSPGDTHDAAGELLSVGTDGEVLFHDLFPLTLLDSDSNPATSRIRRQPPETEQWRSGTDAASTASLSWSPDAGLATARLDGVLQVLSRRSSLSSWNKPAGGNGPVYVRDLRGHEGEATSLAWSPRQGLLASAGADGTVKIWHPVQRQVLRTLAGHDPEPAAGAIFGPGPGQVSSAGGGELRSWDVTTGKLIGERRIESQNQAQQQGLAEIATLSWHPQLQRMAVGNAHGRVIVWDRRDNSLMQMAHHKDEVTALSWHPDGESLASGSFDQTVWISNLKTGEGFMLGKLPDEVTALDWGPDGSVLSSTSVDGSICLSKVAPDEESSQAEPSLICSKVLGEGGSGHQGVVTAVAWNPSGTMLASAGTDRKVILWDPKTGEIRRILSGHTDELTRLAWHPDGKRLASASRDRSVRFWNAETGELILALEHAHEDVVNWVDWSQDGNQLVTTSLDGSVRIWDLDESAWLERARRILNRNLTEEEWRSVVGEGLPHQPIFPELETSEEQP